MCRAPVARRLGGRLQTPESTEDNALAPPFRWFRRILEVQIVLLALACGAAAVAAQGGRWNARLDLLTHPAPLWLAGGIVASVLAWAVRPGAARVVAFASAGAAIGSSLALMSIDIFRPEAPPAVGARMKVIEVNVWYRNQEPGRIIRLIQDEQPDVVVMLEASSQLAAEIAATTGLHVFEGSGATIATREAPVKTHVAWEVRGLPGEPTEFTWVDLPGGGEPFTVIGVHALWPMPSRRAWGQDRNIASLTARLDRGALILAGDFNSTQWSFRQRVADAAFGLERRDRATPTWPARLPLFRGAGFPVAFLSIDHIYAGPAWRTVSVRRGPSVGSDHYPLIAVLARSDP